ncbi:MAG: nucleotidyl transferase AbiEii/AbiGii toxin family protein [Gammaproteobacteria bacterium]|nr:nucleotidyl transferase AbiEii/AbiGii toxin family protein [Gammaproteobacteria bacterium]
MNDAVKVMLAKYRCKSISDYENALKEIMQEIALLGLWRSKFFEKAAFYGGTALRILYGLDRFSEDLDFSLMKPKLDFDLSKYNLAIQMELNSFGFETSVEKKQKNQMSNIKSACIKANTKEQMIYIKVPKTQIKKLHHQQVLKIKMEVDTNPPKDFETEVKILLNPIPFSVNTFQLPDLFATKIHAILCRNWQNRVKGRDWYDLVWYLSRDIPIRLRHLKARLIKSRLFAKDDLLTSSCIIDLLDKKIQKINFKNAKHDVMPFIKNQDRLALWSTSFFKDILSRIKFV